ncbi:hypothetical protein HXZ66_01105 [Bacillus sp. A116_S68]|nr:hypothetical protein HXZ66_01105 [Bacillus sp. A116_S68]
MSTLLQAITKPNRDVINHKIMFTPIVLLLLLNILSSVIAFYWVDIGDVLGTEFEIDRNIGFLITSLVFTIFSLIIQVLLVSLYFWISGIIAKISIEFKRILNIVILATVISAFGQVFNIIQVQITKIPMISGLGGIFEQSYPILSSLLVPIEVFNILHLLFIYVALKQITGKKIMPLTSVGLYLLFQIVINLVPTLLMRSF